MILDRQDKFDQSDLMKEISKHWLCDEYTIVKDLAKQAQLTQAQRDVVEDTASELVALVRQTRLSKSGLDAFMAKYDLSSEEGIVLMCLAEALLRVPDKLTADKLIKDKLTSANWQEHMGNSDHLFVNAATWCLMLTGKILKPAQHKKRFSNVLKNFLDKRSRPVIRRTVMHAMKILGQQYVMGETIQKALKRAQEKEKMGFTYSYDMLGEAATTMGDARFYYQVYYDAITAIGQAANKGNVRKNPGISVKLSALHPRYEVANVDRIHKEMYPKLLQLVELAQSYQIGLNIDAEESERLEISLELVRRLAHEPSLAGFEGIGIVVQAYQKRASFVLDYLIDLAEHTGHRFMVRLVKGAYWDSEIKHAQVEGLEGYPVFTHKCYTDVSYQACVKKLFANTTHIYPQFATHNAYTTAMIIELAGEYRDFEFQCLHGMGDALYDHVVGEKHFNIPCRIYAPVGTYKHLLPYLVRRLLENGANSSFVHRIVDAQTPIEDLVEDPVEKAQKLNFKQHRMIPLPANIYGEDRMNSKSYNLNDTRTLEQLALQMSEHEKESFEARPLVEGVDCSNLSALEVKNPANNNTFGYVYHGNETIAKKAMENAYNAFESWDLTAAKTRADVLKKCADLLEEHMPRLMAIAVKEAGKTFANAVAEIREAVDFCRYYAMEAEKEFSQAKILPGPTGELNKISLHGRGVIVCISPWNFPLAIFLGQVTAALAAGNTVVAKPAEQTPIIAYEAVKLLYQAGVPKNVLQFVPGTGEEIGASLVQHDKVAGVVFTGSTEVAKGIQKTLANKPGAIIPLIAETGGQNVMVVDSSALPEQVVKDVLNSAFNSAGQRCSALRVLYLQKDIADNVIEMLKGAMAELKVSDPSFIESDVGPVIDKEAKENLQTHIKKLKGAGKLVYEVASDKSLAKGNFVYPVVFEIDSISALSHEVFGPVLHIVRFDAKDLHKVVDEINATGYGLTFGIHSRIQETVDFFQKRIRVGNIYVNRDIVGAVVGVQPFGGQGLSGTGPKAGGPFYLHRLATERSVSIDTTAAGGNASLMSLEEAQ
ncbi:bifunctional proline dehydrogenase/L-glutamate gamma-semialdehyde dehydrogenase PutA [Facilibium subflavum]|uniref:bifunctional proline dehydrogenase/L-glutamate gamma-semialdehyde dehydrogenase PutA n=1 Tax=Facilibium subflavum TaxID=2219058 RepID=UPI000E64BCDF|nr:bifunctional proline dehydrogenase/L-glutamate gamma-semialdehyde dehydrogenase PutA [Facilibium subflavum]